MVEKFTHKKASKRSGTGVLGVHRYWRTSTIRKGGRAFKYRREVVGALHPNGKARREFSIDRHGVREAMRLAKLARAKMVKEHLG